jgi:hypothetical protein
MAVPGPSPTDPVVPPVADPSGAGPVLPDPDWPAQATDAIVRAVDTVRSKTTGPALTAVRYLALGLALFLLLTPLFIAGLVGAMRGVEHFLWYVWPKWEQPMWFVYLVFGTAFTAAGLWMWGRSARSAAAT